MVSGVHKYVGGCVGWLGVQIHRYPVDRWEGWVWGQCSHACPTSPLTCHFPLQPLSTTTTLSWGGVAGLTPSPSPPSAKEDKL